MASAPLETALVRLRAAQAAQSAPTLDSRRQRLLGLRRYVLAHRERFCEAIGRDYGHRSRHETLLCEVAPVLAEIDHALAHLGRWMRPQRRGIDRLRFGFSRNEVIPQPLGVVGVIVPWNFPINLSLSPLVSILAAGNRAMLKMSERSPRLAALIAETLPSALPADTVEVFAETGTTGEAFSRLPLDHLLFTGSTATGRAVMAAAAANLCPVTLELGGRSPALVCDDADLPGAAERILDAKCLNAGQICVSVDHAWLPRASVAPFIEQARSIAARRYGSLDSPDLSSIIDARAWRRLVDLLDDARARGARVLPLLPGAPMDEATHRLAPHLVVDAPADCRLLREEIFGPILPLLPYDRLEDAVSVLREPPRPLAFYPFTRDRSRLDRLLAEVMSGGVCVNDTLLQVAQPGLPFGGIGASGMGHYHGHEGFLAFSKLRPVHHASRLSARSLLYPPFSRTTDRLLRFLLR
ncbi:MAG: coniferyl aldehyde dehydrogenase [Pseudomonadota bacterium]|jgi:coniferyl-aldehyde dehydrogenase